MRPVRTRGFVFGSFDGGKDAIIKGGFDLAKTRDLPDYDLGGILTPHIFVGVSGYMSVWRSLKTSRDILAEPIWGPGEAEASGIGAG